MAVSNSQSAKSTGRDSWPAITVLGLGLLGASIISITFIAYSAPDSQEYNGAKFVGIEIGSPPTDDPEMVRKGAAEIKRLEKLNKRMEDNGW